MARTSHNFRIRFHRASTLRLDRKSLKNIHFVTALRGNFANLRINK